MGVFSQRPEEELQEWAGLPSEPRDHENVADRLDDAPAIDPLSIGLGVTSTTVVFPVALPAPEAPEASDTTGGGGGGGGGD